MSVYISWLNDKVGAKLTLQVCVLKTPIKNMLKMMNGYEQYLHFISLGNVSGMNHLRFVSSSVSRNLNNATGTCGIRPVV